MPLFQTHITSNKAKFQLANKCHARVPQATSTVFFTRCPPINSFFNLSMTWCQKEESLPSYPYTELNSSTGNSGNYCYCQAGGSVAENRCQPLRYHQGRKPERSERAEQSPFAHPHTRQPRYAPRASAAPPALSAAAAALQETAGAARRGAASAPRVFVLRVSRATILSPLSSPRALHPLLHARAPLAPLHLVPSSHPALSRREAAPAHSSTDRDSLYARGGATCAPSSSSSSAAAALLFPTTCSFLDELASAAARRRKRRRRGFGFPGAGRRLKIPFFHSGRGSREVSRLPLFLDWFWFALLPRGHFAAGRSDPCFGRDLALINACLISGWMLWTALDFFMVISRWNVHVYRPSVLVPLSNDKRGRLYRCAQVLLLPLCRSCLFLACPRSIRGSNAGAGSYAIPPLADGPVSPSTPRGTGETATRLCCCFPPSPLLRLRLRLTTSLCGLQNSRKNNYCC